MTMTRRSAMALPLFATLAPRFAFAQTADTINLAILTPLTGPYAFTGQRELAGWQDAVDYINARGGAGGKKMLLLALDTEYKVDVGVAQWKKAIAAGPVHFAKSDSIPLARAMQPENNDRYKMLLATTANGSQLTEAEGFKNFFIPAPTYSDLTEMTLLQIEKIAGKGSKPKVAFVHSNIEFGRDPVPHTLKRAKELGFDLVLEDETAMTGVDVSASAIKLRNARPDFILFHGYAGNVWPDVLRQARDYNVKAVAMGTIWSVDPDTVKGIGAAADGFLGVVPHTLDLETKNTPLMKDIQAAAKKRQGNAYYGYGGIGYMSGWATALLLQEMFNRAAANKDSFDGAGLYRALATIKNWDSGGVFGGPVSIERQRVPIGTIYKYNVAPDKFSLTAVAEGIKAG